MRSAMGFVTVVGMTLSSYAAAQNAALAKFCLRNADNYTSEVVAVEGISLGGRATARGELSHVRIDLDTITGRVTYDPDAGELRFSTPVGDSFMLDTPPCRPTGTYIGQNAFGARLRVTREVCDGFFLDGGGRMLPGSVKMSPSQYRTVTKQGIKRVEIDFAVAVGPGGTVAKMNKGYSEPRFDFPKASVHNNCTMFGDIEAVRWLIPGTGMVEVWRK